MMHGQTEIKFQWLVNLMDFSHFVVLSSDFGAAFKLCVRTGSWKLKVEYMLFTAPIPKSRINEQFKYIHTYIRTYLHTYYIHTCIHTSVRTYVRAYMHTHTHTRIIMHSYINTHVREYVAKYIQSYKFLSCSSPLYMNACPWKPCR